MPALAQTLHGYDRGHRLLAHGGDLREAELSLLDRLSDLSGYLPSGVSFDSYYTGFPCGRYYALACTWLDVGARRGGTVLTHTLLIPLAHAEHMQDLLAAAEHHRRPRSAEDWQPYTEPIDERPPPEVSEAPPEVPGEPPGETAISPPAHARDTLALYFGQRDRPILWLDTTQPLAQVRYLWRLSWPAVRRRFAFCTFALQERTLDGRPFDFLGLPPEAQGAFHKLAGSMAWWRQGELGHPGLAALPLVQTIEQEGPTLIPSLIDHCRTLDLPAPTHPSDLSALRKLIEVRAAARRRLTAARAWADLLARLWPALPAQHAEWRAALDALMDTQAQAALDPRSLWELTQLVERPQARALAHDDPAFARRMDELVEHELARRLAAVPERTSSELPGLMDALAGRPEQHAIHRAVQRALRQAGGLDQVHTLARTLVRITAARRDAGLLETCLAPLPPPERRAVLVGPDTTPAAENHAQRDFLHREGTRLAVKLGDPELAFALHAARGAPASGLSHAAQAALAYGDLASLDPVLQRVDAETCLAWSLDITEPALARHAAPWGAEAANDLQLAPAELAVHCTGKPNGARLFAHRYHRRFEDRLADVLSDEPALAWDLAMLALTEPDTVGSLLLRAAIQALPGEQLWAPASREALGSHTGAPGLRTWLEHLGPRLLLDIARELLDPDQGASWLRLPPVQSWLNQAGRFAIERCLARPQRTWLRSMIRAMRGALPEEAPAPPGMLEPIVCLVQTANRAHLDLAASDLLDLLRQPACQDAIRLRAELLLAVQRTEPDTGARLAAEVFHPTYAAVLANRREIGSVRWPWSWGWDRGKQLRHWLLDTWVERGWPLDELVRCLNGDEALAHRIFRRASRRFHARKLMFRLEPALRHQPVLHHIWEKYFA